MGIRDLKHDRYGYHYEDLILYNPMVLSIGVSETYKWQKIGGNKSEQVSSDLKALTIFSNPL